MASLGNISVSVRSLFFLLVILLLMVVMGPHYTYAQSSRADSIQILQKERKRISDSTREARKAFSESLAAVRKYKESKRYKDSVERKRNARLDSLKTIRTHINDSVKFERTRILDSAKNARAAISDSIKQSRQARLDSLTKIKKHKESKFYKDSVVRVRQVRLDSISRVRKAISDSTIRVRTAYLDSVKKVRAAYSDSVAQVRKKRADSLAKIRKYKTSKRYSDSVGIIKQNRLDSIRIVRKRINDSASAERKLRIDSTMAARKKFNDSITAIRTARQDSLAAIRKIRQDSLAKKAEAKEKMAEAKQKSIEEKSKLKFELKLAKKRSAWSNEKMLKKKWNVPRKAIQNTFTRYNYYFNAQNKMYEAEKNMQRAATDNYDTLLALFPFDPDRDSTKMLADMDSIIQKTSLGIQIHDPRTKWGDDLYLLLGQAYYYKGNYKDALASFRYVVSLRQQRLAAQLKKNAGKMSREERLAKSTLLEQNNNSWVSFFKHQSVHNEAILWLARTNTEMNKVDDAGSILDLIEIDKNVDEQLAARIALEKAYLYLNTGDLKGAQIQLDTVVKDKTFPLWLRQRATFLNAQLNEKQGNYKKAYDLFDGIARLAPSAEMQFYASKNAAYNLLKTGGNYQDAIARMKYLLKDGKFDKYSDQIYYILGKLSETNQQRTEAIEYYKKGIELPKATRRNKAILYASLGEVYYQNTDYKLAKSAYDSASVYGRNAQDNPDVMLATKRAQLVDNIVLPLEIIHGNDSLLALSEMESREQLNQVRTHIRNLRRQLQQQKLAETLGAGQDILASAGPTGSSWYFSNPGNFQLGSNDFKRKFGNRPLTDNWRRTSAIGFNNATAGTSGDANNEPTNINIDEDGLPTEEYLLFVIPKTEEEKDKLRKESQRAYVDLGKAYITELDEYSKGLERFTELNNKYSVHDYPDEVAYWRYTAFLQQNNMQDAQSQVNLLMQSYPQSRWAKLVAPQNEQTEHTVAIPIETYYQEAYNHVLNRQYETSLNESRKAYSLYQQAVYQRRFQIIEGISLAGLGKYTEADTLMKNFISANSNDTLTRWADAIIRFVAEKKLEDSIKKASIIPPVDSVQSGLVANASATAIDSVKAPALVYKFTPGSEHMLVIGFTNADARMNALQAGMKDYHLLQHSSANLQTNILYFSAVDVVISVSKFPNVRAAYDYENALKLQAVLFRDFKPSDYTIFFISSDNLKILQQTKKLEDYLRFYQKNYKR